MKSEITAVALRVVDFSLIVVRSTVSRGETRQPTVKPRIATVSPSDDNIYIYI